VSFLSLFLAIDDDEMVVVMPIALFFSRSSMIVRADEKEKPSSRIRAIIIRILPREKEKRKSYFVPPRIAHLLSSLSPDRSRRRPKSLSLSSKDCCYFFY